MCGISGILSLNLNLPIDEQKLIAMNNIQEHRGPDASGVYSKGCIGLAHRRLSIIDLAGGHQPMTNEDGTVWISYNGEIYNHDAIRKYLRTKGHIFRTRSDTEVILHAYEEFGPECVNHFIGMFSFAVWNEKKKELFAARDRLGIKPFYYALQDGQFIFASEIKAILIHQSVSRIVNTEALNYYLKLRYVPGPLTMFQNIKKLMPGHYILIKNGCMTEHKYWEVDHAKEPNHTDSAESIQEQMENLLENCIQMRLMSEVPLGVFLSGGIDSSLIAATMARMATGRVKTFCIGPEKANGAGEFAFARMIADRFDTEHHEYPITAQSFYDFIPDFVWHMDEPVSDPASIPLYFLSKYSRPHATVVLSGEGADEVFAGYYIYKKMLLIEELRKLNSARILLLKLAKISSGEKYQRYLEMASLPLEERYRGVSKVFTAAELIRLYRNGNNPATDHDSVFSKYYKKTESNSPLNRMLYVDMNTWLPDDLLVKADKMTMASSQELRVPFLDHRLVEYVYSLPPNQKIRGRQTKYLLRKAAEKVIPKEIIKRNKVGFYTPIDKWFQEDFNGIAKAVLLDTSSACSNYFHCSYMESLLDDHKSGRVNNGEKLWNLLVFEIWHKRFIRS